LDLPAGRSGEAETAEVHREFAFLELELDLGEGGWGDNGGLVEEDAAGRGVGFDLPLAERGVEFGGRERAIDKLLGVDFVGFAAGGLHPGAKFEELAGGAIVGDSGAGVVGAGGG
jgi:hypothetical protein